MRVYFGLDLLVDYELSDFSLYLFDREIESLGDFSKVYDFVRSHILNQSLLPDVLDDEAESVAEMHIVLKFTFNLRQSLLEFHVLSIEIVLDDICCFRHLFHEVFELRAAQDVISQVFSIETRKGTQGHVKCNILGSTKAIDRGIINNRHVSQSDCCLFEVIYHQASHPI